MTNDPTLRSRLQKAEDADVHPSTPVDTGPETSLRRPGASTADSVGMPDKDKLVSLDVKVPKSLRKSVRREAERRGVSVDEIVAEALRDRAQR
ncbi:MAG: hypothetical protein GC156_12505 [Actinomycetales bacterium]|nr:hypothetical protein [Actinomycetales bacterium]